MLCPYCQHTNHLEIDMHSEGFSSSVMIECADCGALLTLKKSSLDTIHGPTHTVTQEEVSAP